MVKLVTPPILQKHIKLGTLEIPNRPKVDLTFKYLKHPKTSVWNLPDPRESLWETVPIEDEMFKIKHYMDKNKSYRTTYGKMNEWMKMPGGRDVRSGLPVTMSDGSWQQGATRPGEGGRPVQTNDYNAKFRDSYVDLTSKIAYRFPNPGLPRLRQGSIGGSWRHIKEVLGHGGSRVCYVDGLVAVYDEENFNQKLQAQSPYRPHLRRQLYSANRGYDHEAARIGRTGSVDPPREQGVHLPSVEELPMMSTNERDRKLAIQSQNKHKGVYSYTRNYHV